jgi:hypothetical protein
MNRFKKALGVGFIFTLYVMCFYFFVAVMQAVFQGTDVVKAALDSVVVGFVMWGVFTFGLFEFFGWVEERNRLEAEYRKQQEEEYRKQANLPPVEQKHDGSDSTGK